MKSKPGWKLLSNHAHVLLCLSNDSHMRLRDLAEKLGITERAIQRIVTELEQAGILSHQREGRRNFYRIHSEQTLLHPLEQSYSVGLLLAAVANSDMNHFNTPNPPISKVDLPLDKGASTQAT